MSKKVSRKQLLDMAKALKAEDATERGVEWCKKHYRELEPIAYCTGTAGVNGRIFKHTKLNKYYFVKSRSSAFFALPN